MSPLAGVAVVITRDDPALAAALRGLGADVAVVPLVGVAPLGDLATLRGVDLAAYDWLMLTSANGVESVAEHLGAPPTGTRIAVVGAATARAVEAAFGRPVDFVPRDQRAAGMLAEFVEPPARVVAIHADAAAPTLVDGLRAAGHDVTSVVGYRTVVCAPTDEQLVTVVAADVIVVASSSAVRALAAADGAEHTGIGGGDVDRQRPLVAIGPSTAATAAELGFTQVVTAADPSTASLTAAVVAFTG